MPPTAPTPPHDPGARAPASPAPARPTAAARFALLLSTVLPIAPLPTHAAPAPAPATPTPTQTQTATWWAFAPLPPSTTTAATAATPASNATPARPGRHPVDVLTLADADSAPRPDRRTLLRRLMVDLHGLLPTPGEVEAFEQDPAPDALALEHQIDRLLASPRYGERWARHWLDVVHFAETHGHDQDRPRDSAWPYRDYVIEAFNSDRPYARFVQEQIAADALFPDEPRLLPALGFLAAGPWDESSLRDIREETLDREIGRYLDRDDIVANVMSTFTSVTAHCARCHDHKFDPVSQQDYYALQAVFAGTEKAERLYDEDPATCRIRERWMRLQTALERRDTAHVEALLTPELRAEQAAWESDLAQSPTAWTLLTPAEITTDPPTDLRPQPDLSLLAAGPNPATNTYTVTTALPDSLPRVTAVRLEVLPDDSLPARGPGRAANGNLHLTRFELHAAPQGTNVFHPAPLSRAEADFNQEGWDIARAIDSDPATGWGIHPQESRPHAAVFELQPDPAAPRPARLRFVLTQGHGRQHTLGRFRLSATSTTPPVRAIAMPDAVLAALAISPPQRSADQRFQVTAFFLEGRPARELARLPEPRRVFAGTSVFPANGGQKALTRPRPVHVLRRGEITKPTQPAEPGALSCIPGLPARFDRRDLDPSPATDPYPGEEALRRADLARWLAHRDNPLVWRSIVNRVWQHHFGRGIVETPNDFGRMGGAPSAPELLDDLAVRFRDDLGGSLKRLHRFILTSATWQRRAAPPSEAGPLQPQVRRLDAETFRDSLLRMTGQLDTTEGGPSVRLFAMTPGIHVTPNVDYAAFDPDGPGSRRRAIYRFLFRTLPDPLMDTLDCPAGDQSAPVRGESFTALQAFALLHHPFVVRQSQHLADDLQRAHPGIRDQVTAACRRIWQRAPDPQEQQAFANHAREHGLPHLCRLLLNSNELHFID